MSSENTLYVTVVVNGIDKIVIYLWVDSFKLARVEAMVYKNSFIKRPRVTLEPRPFAWSETYAIQFLPKKFWFNSAVFQLSPKLIERVIFRPVHCEWVPCIDSFKCLRLKLTMKHNIWQDPVLAVCARLRSLVRLSYFFECANSLFAWRCAQKSCASHSGHLQTAW